MTTILNTLNNIVTTTVRNTVMECVERSSWFGSTRECRDVTVEEHSETNYSGCIVLCAAVFVAYHMSRPVMNVFRNRVITPLRTWCHNTGIALIRQALTPPVPARSEEPIAHQSMYRPHEGNLYITLDRNRLASDPCRHLCTFSNCVTADTRIHVQFTGEPGIDGGGLAREYIDLLTRGWKTLLKIDSLSHLPQTQQPYQNGRPFPNLDTANSHIYHCIGEQIAFCYTKGNLPMGRVFNPALFNAALSLTPAERTTDFTHLTPATHLKMVKALIEGMGQTESYRDRLTLFEKTTWGPEDRRKAYEQAMALSCLPADFDFNPEDASQEPILRQGIKDALFQDFGASLHPIHAIAQGLDLFGMEPVAPAQFKEFDRTVQGAVDRTPIINAIRCSSDTPEIVKKTAWLKDWLRTDATDEEVSLFVKLATGSSSLGCGQSITIESQSHPSSGLFDLTGAQTRDYMPFPSSHSCFNTIYLSPIPVGTDAYNDRTREAFIHVLKATLDDPDAFRTSIQ